MKQEILSLIGKNQTKPLSFKDKEYKDVYGIYSYKGDIFCFKEGMDIPFDDLLEKEQKEILKLVKEKKYKIDPTLQ